MLFEGRLATEDLQTLDTDQDVEGSAELLGRLESIVNQTWLER